MGRPLAATLRSSQAQRPRGGWRSGGYASVQEWWGSRGRSWSTEVPNVVRRVGQWWQDANGRLWSQDLDTGKWWVQDDQGNWRSTTAVLDTRTGAWRWSQ